MSNYVQVLDGLPKDGLRLGSGLALRLTSGNGMAVLGCSRINAVPSDEEMTCIQDAVWQLFSPEILLQAVNITLILNDDGEHHIRRLYWPLEGISIVKTRAIQQHLFDLGARA